VHKFWQRAVDSSLPSLQSAAPSQIRACCRHSPDRQAKSKRQSEDDEEEEEEEEEGEEEEEEYEGGEVRERDGRRLPAER
jgi:ribosomal protein L12E/L44/L45/RPP1/RPP2